jgi:DNA topoisomerase-1
MPTKMQLVIVESPTKAKTISKFLPKEYQVESSYGHVRDLPKGKFGKTRFGIDIKNNFRPQYVIPKTALAHVERLKEAAVKAADIILATDEDREGEAIAWHITEIFKENGLTKNLKDFKRIVFHEITKKAITEALEKPRALDMNLVNAQQARRVLDRLVGYELSPFLWRKIRYGLSAGRVQSVAARLVVEREREIENFKKEEYWSIEGIFNKISAKETFRAKLHSIGEKNVGKMSIGNQVEAKKIIADLKNEKYFVSNITTKEVNRSPASPFTTSTLQQEAARKLGFSAKQTMVIAQKLYENGYITYMRTDSLNVASSALDQAKKVITEKFGEKYALPNPRHYSNKTKGAQEAHEAIRPTDLGRKLGENFTLEDRGQHKLYDLIWKRTIASQMQSATLLQTTVDILTENKKYSFRASGQTIIFDGFIHVYTEGRDDALEENNNEEDEEGVLPQLLAGDKINAQKIEPLQHFTEPPPRYTDATLIKALESYGIGRPSTYAPTLSTIQERDYVEKIDKKYHPTEIGMLVNDMLVENFPEIVDINFTSHIEEEFDEIAEGKIKWPEVIREFYVPFKKHLEEKEETVIKKVEVSQIPCPHCGKPMIIKFGRMGKFLACPDPESKVTLPLPEEAAKIKELTEKTKDERCPICGKAMEVKRGRFGYFLGCVDYPKCKGILKIWTKLGFKCPNCLASLNRKDNPGDIVEKKARGRGKIFYACTRYPDCNFVMNKKPENEDELKELYEKWLANPPKPKSKKVGLLRKNNGWKK